ncbi:thermonuclease family protein [Rhizobium bangladeshense]|uniref:thermonuclease family protein n=1 Tax=Rhizobium bangladeshense TaxID=1138189 RepID=UPI001C8393CE|nr:thermonuclease family protein [Rhizobium bangladeshense]MBX4895965.1 thermonuclease family protein [Rhizobium bangladeshense]MBY3613099.1 thermonuclease family protein [Rhizobium bangladeshense]
MRPAAIFTGITGMAVVVGLLMAGEARLRGGTAGEETAPAGETAAAPDAAPEPTERAATISDERAEMIARSVVPAGSPPPEPPDRAAPKPETITQQAAPVEKKAMELPRPLVENAGSLSFGERRLHLAGIVPTPADRICGPAGRQWPCGMMAKTALRQLLRNRSITCDLDAVEWKGTAIATCRLGTQDLGTWLAENGWAEAEAGLPLAPIAEKTRQAQKGIYGGDPRRK